MKFRIAQKPDWQKITDIYNQAVDDGMNTADTEHVELDKRIDWFYQHNETDYPIIVAETEKEIVGWCSLSPYRPGRKALRRTAEISYYLDRSYRGKGLGTELVDYSIKLAKSIGIKNLLAILLDENRISIKLLEKFGFSEWGHLPDIADFDDRKCGQYIYGRNIEDYQN